MQLKASAEDPPIYRELVEQWNRRHQQEEPEPVSAPSSRWSRAYKRVTDWLKGPEAKQSGDKLAAYRPAHRRIAHA